LKPVILFVIDTLQAGGAERSLLDILSRFNFYRPVMVVLYAKGTDLDGAYKSSGIEVIRLDQSEQSSFKKIAKELRHIILSVSPALIHSTLFRSDMVSRIAADGSGIPLINSLVNNSYSWRRYRSEPWDIKFKLLIVQLRDVLTARRVAMFVANSQVIKRASMRALGILASRINVIHRGRSSEAFNNVSTEEIRQFRQSLGLEGKMVWLNVSRLIPRKGHLTLIKAFSMLAEKETNSILLIAGTGPLLAELQAIIESEGLSEKIFLLGSRNDIPLLMRSSDYFVFPTLYEGLPGVLIEAMFARLPIIASNIPENLECISNDCAMFHKPNNADNLYRKMKKATQISDWSLKTELAFNMAVKKFDIQEIVSQYENLYDRLLTSAEVE
jgi:glycosyltransferase involved in cell wall biosynthesis